MIISLLSVVVWYLLIRRLKVTNSRLLFILPFIISYLLYVCTAGVYSEYLKYVLYSYDLNGDRMFSPDEYSPEQEQALLAVTNDVSRSLAWLFGIFYAVVFGTAVNSLRCIVAKISRGINRKTTST